MYLLLVLTVLIRVDADDLYSIDLAHAVAYSSSVAKGHAAAEAIDYDFDRPTPTCFETDGAFPDSQGLQWIIIDFGQVVRNIREIRLVKGRYDDESGKDIMTAYVLSSLEIPKHVLLTTTTTTSRIKQNFSLPWKSTNFQHCATEKEPSFKSSTATLRCDKSLDGRWVVIRKRGKLNICLLSVHVEKAFAQCFKTISVNEPVINSGLVYRLIRHVSLNVCRSNCMKSYKCDALLYSKHGRRVRSCQLFHQFGQQMDGLPGEKSMKNHTRLCEHAHCELQINYCHTGNIMRLKRITMQDDLRENEEEIDEVWNITQTLQTPSAINQTTLFLISVQFDGEIYCSIWNCGVVDVLATDKHGMETLCTRINTEKIRILWKHILFCNSHFLPQNPEAIRLRWKAQKHAKGHISSGLLKLNLTEAHVRLSATMTQITRTISTTEIPQITHDQIIHEEETIFSTTEANFTTKATFSSKVDTSSSPKLQSTHSTNSQIRHTTPAKHGGRKPFNYPLNDQEQLVDTVIPPRHKKSKTMKEPNVLLKTETIDGYIQKEISLKPVYWEKPTPHNMGWNSDKSKSSRINNSLYLSFSTLWMTLLISI